MILKKIIILTAIIGSLFSCNRNQNSNSNPVESVEKKTSFQSFEELDSYTHDKSYEKLKSLWGEGEMGEPWDASGVGELNVRMKITWKNVKYKGKPIVVEYKSPVDFSKQPLDFIAISDY